MTNERLNNILDKEKLKKFKNEIDSQIYKYGQRDKSTIVEKAKKGAIVTGGCYVAGGVAGLLIPGIAIGTGGIIGAGLYVGFKVLNAYQKKQKFKKPTKNL